MKLEDNIIMMIAGGISAACLYIALYNLFINLGYDDKDAAEYTVFTIGTLILIGIIIYKIKK